MDKNTARDWRYTRLELKRKGTH